MNVLCIIPARGGSRRLPSKNILPVAGKPLLAYSIEQALYASSVDKVAVSTDDLEIASIAKSYGAEVIDRPLELATDTATSESALIHGLKEVEKGGGHPDLIVFLQCTSPIRRPNDIDGAVEMIGSSDADSLFSATDSRWLIWRRDQDGLLPVNYDYTNRQREQIMPKEFRENGSIYVFKPWVLKEHKNRLGGKITVYPMDYWSSFQVDSHEDLELCEWVIRKRDKESRKSRLPQDIELVVFDFDGVFTDNRVLVSQSGKESVYCSREDSLGISLLQKKGIPLMVLSTESNPVVDSRCAKIGIECSSGVTDKLLSLQRIMKTRSIVPENVIYLGNDINDLECIRAVGCGAAVADSAHQILNDADLILKRRGGSGAVRELCDLILESTKP